MTMQKISTIISQISLQIQKNEEEGENEKKINNLLVKLENTSPSPSVPLSILAPALINQRERCESAASDNPTTVLSTDDALSIITSLIKHNPSLYAVPAARAVRLEVEHLSSSFQAQRPNIEISESFLNALIGQLQSFSTEVADNVSQTLLTLCKTTPHFMKRIILSLVQNRSQLQHDPSINVNRNHLSTTAVRYASLLVSIITSPHCGNIGHLDESMQVSQNSALDVLLLDLLSLDEDDTLLQMSVLDLITELATVLPMSSLRKEWLVSSKVVEPLLALVGGEENCCDEVDKNTTTTPHPILGGCALSILSSICANVIIPKQNEEVLLPRFYTALRTFAQCTNNEVERIALVNAISSLVSTSEHGLNTLLEEEQNLILREKWLDLSGVPQSKLKALILCSVARVMDLPLKTGLLSLEHSTRYNLQSNVNGQVQRHFPSSALSLKLFQCFGKVNGGSGPEVLMNFSKSPFVEERLASYELMRAFVFSVREGAQILLSYAGFMEFLQSRGGESVKEGKEAKFTVVEAVLNSEARKLLAENTVKCLARIVSEGPHYVEAVNWEVAID